VEWLNSSTWKLELILDHKTLLLSNMQDFTIIKYAACQSWQAYMGLPTKLQRAARPHPGDSKSNADVRSIDIAEIGSNSRKQTEHEDTTFRADAEPPDDKRGEEQRFEMDTAGTAGESMI
jgi:hypothetical protein